MVARIKERPGPYAAWVPVAERARQGEAAKPLPVVPKGSVVRLTDPHPWTLYVSSSSLACSAIEQRNFHFLYPGSDLANSGIFLYASS